VGSSRARHLPPSLPSSVYGAQRKQVALPTDFRSPPENGHSRYAYPTARFAPIPAIPLRCRPAQSGEEAAVRRRPGRPYLIGTAGIELIAEGAVSPEGGRGIRLKKG